MVVVRPKVRNADSILARLGTRSKGVATRRELLREGLTPAEIKRRLETGALSAEFRGVYRIGHRAPDVLARYLAAVKACGEGAVLSGKAAAWLWGLIERPPPPPEVSAPTERRVKGLATRHRRLHHGDVTTHRGIPVTTVPLTLLDLSPLLTRENLALACHEAGVKYRTSPRAVRSILARHPNIEGAAKLRAVLEGEPVSLSKLEARFLDLLREAGLPLPITNKPAGGRRVDCRWPEFRLTVELDSYRFHNSRHSWEQDRRREREAYGRGDGFRRYTWMDVTELRGALLRELTALLASAAA